MITTQDGPASVFAVVVGCGAQRGGSLLPYFQGLMYFLGEQAFFGVRTFGTHLRGSLSRLPGFLMSLLIDGGSSINLSTALTLASSLQILDATDGDRLIFYEQ